MTKTNKLFSYTAAPYIQEFCKPWHNIALTNFMHDITFGHGQISMLVSNAQVFKFYYEHKIPMLCTNDSGRTLAAGIYLNKILEQQYKDCSVLMPLMVKVGNQYDQSFGQTSLHLVEREGDCQHLYTLFFDMNETDFLHWIVNNGNFLKDFIAHYNHTAKDIVKEAKISKNRIILPNSASSKNELETVEKKLLSTKLVHKENKLPIYLSSQQNRCMDFLMQGKSAKEIVLEMKLSHRTIEHYLEKIKMTLGCASNKELIISYYDQVHK